MFPRLLSLEGEAAVTVGPVMVILTTAHALTITMAVTTVTRDAPTASAPTTDTTAVPAPKYASLSPSLTISTDPTLNFSTPHTAPTQARLPYAITTHHPWGSVFSASSVSGAVTAM